MKLNIIQEAIANVSGSTFVGIDTETVVKLGGGKKNPYQGKLIKRMIGANVMLFSNTNMNSYSNMVKRRLEKEGKNPEEFTVGPRAWGERVENMPLVKHKDETYLEVIFLKAGNVEYVMDGNIIDKPEEIEGFPTVKATGGEQGGLEDKVIIRTFNVNSITGIRANGQSFSA